MPRPAEHPNTAIRLNNLALLLRDTHRLAEAEPLFLRALAITEKSFGPEHPNVAIRLNNLAGLLLLIGHYHSCIYLNHSEVSQALIFLWLVSFSGFYLLCWSDELPLQPCLKLRNAARASAGIMYW
jgi:Tetratricopeptide repeat